ncbi:hypothetical protein HAX54_016714, partial [Datura stramonium]|nr:hypothetical protein [Datura stramonium]
MKFYVFFGRGRWTVRERGENGGEGAGFNAVVVGGGRRKNKKGEGSVRDWIASVFDFGGLSKIMVGVEHLVFHGWFRSEQGGVRLWCGGSGFQKIGSVDGPWWRGEATGQKE